MADVLSKKRAQQLASAVHSLIVRRHGVCEAGPVAAFTIGCYGPLQDAHIIPRQAGHHITMMTSELDNLRASWCLCAAHHRQTDSRPDLWTELVIATVGLAHVRALRCFLDDREEAMQGMSVLMWWRSQYARLLKHAKSTGVDLKTIPRKWQDYEA